MGLENSKACQPDACNQQHLAPAQEEEAEYVVSHAGDDRRPGIPKLLRMTVPNGPSWTAGLYRLSEGERANGQPVWKATHAQAWLYSMTNGKWGIGGQTEFDAGFQAGAAFVFCDEPHFGAMPDRVQHEWMHNRPAWTPDRRISVESWPETIQVLLEKANPADKFGMQAAILEAPEGSEDLPTLRVHLIGSDSLLARWNGEVAAAGQRGQAVPEGSDIIRVGQFVDPAQMLEALLQDARVEVVFRRPEHKRTLRQDVTPETASFYGSGTESVDKLGLLGSECSTEGPGSAMDSP